MLTIDKTASALYPNVKMGLLAMQNIPAAAPLAPTITAEATEAILRRYSQLDRAGLKAVYPIQPYVAYYRKFGCSYHVLAQLESLLKGTKQPQAAIGILQAMFLTELETMLLTAGHDLASVRLPLRLEAATGGETYRSISGKEVTAAANDLMVCDDGGVRSSIMRGPDQASRITAATTGVIFTIYAPPGIRGDTVAQALQLLETRIRSFAPVADTLLLQVYG